MPHNSCWARMQAEHPTVGGSRPVKPRSARPDAPMSARRFLCEACRSPAIICSHCDRGNIYCGRRCSENARRTRQREAGDRHQRTPSGRRKHAVRQGRYRASRKIVTHQGPPRRPEGADLPPATADDVAIPPALIERPQASTATCHWCGSICLPFLRVEFMRRRGRRRGRD